MVNSIKKGKRFERIVASLLTKITGKKWMRVPQSGAFSTVNGSDKPQFKGDVFCEDKEYRDIVVECKMRRRPILFSEIFNPYSKLWSWISQAERESKNNRWVLFFKSNYSPIFIASWDVELIREFGYRNIIIPTFVHESIREDRNIFFSTLYDNHKDDNNG